jgi:hypothetical protein
LTDSTTNLVNQQFTLSPEKQRLYEELAGKSAIAEVGELLGGIFGD